MATSLGRRFAGVIALVAMLPSAGWADDNVRLTSSSQGLQVLGNLELIATNKLVEVVPFESLATRTGLYGLGMPMGLHDELLVIDGKAYRSRFDGSGYKVVSGDPGDVAFFAYQYVTKWESVSVPPVVTDFPSLHAFIAARLSSSSRGEGSNGLFRLKADVEYLRYFVVGGMGNLLPTPRDSFLRNRMLGGLDNRTIEAVGIYAPFYQGRATSPSTPLHVHFRTTDDREVFVGHVDNEVRFVPGTLKLFFPTR